MPSGSGINEALTSAFHANGAGAGTHQTCGDLEQRGLAAPWCSHEDRNLAGAERQIHVVNDGASFLRLGSEAKTSDVSKLLQRRRTAAAFALVWKPLDDSRHDQCRLRHALPMSHTP